MDVPSHPPPPHPTPLLEFYYDDGGGSIDDGDGNDYDIFSSLAICLSLNPEISVS